MKNRTAALVTLIFAAAFSTGCIFADYDDIVYPAYGEMTFVPNGHTCTGDEETGQIGRIYEMRDAEYPQRVVFIARCLIPDIPEPWNPNGSSEAADFNLAMYWPDGTTFADIGPTNRWMTIPASFDLVATGAPPGCFGSNEGEQKVEMYVSGHLPDFDHIEIRAEGDCGLADIHIPGGDSQ
jgi:hypothetical protein